MNIDEFIAMIAKDAKLPEDSIKMLRIDELQNIVERLYNKKLNIALVD